MSALTVLIIRHGEKPEGDAKPFGIDADGEQHKKSLLVRGWQRAGAWATLFGAGLGGDLYPQPGVIYAVNPDLPADADDDMPSHRPLETITPLADRLHLTPDIRFAQDQGPALVAEITALTGVVLICWEHKRIGTDILPSLLNGQKLPNVPAKWDGSRFNVVLRLDRAMPDAPWTFRQLFPCLLTGDSDVPM